MASEKHTGKRSLPIGYVLLWIAAVAFGAIVVVMGQPALVLVTIFILVASLVAYSLRDPDALVTQKAARLAAREAQVKAQQEKAAQAEAARVAAEKSTREQAERKAQADAARKAKEAQAAREAEARAVAEKALKAQAEKEAAEKAAADKAADKAAADKVAAEKAAAEKAAADKAAADKAAADKAAADKAAADKAAADKAAAEAARKAQEDAEKEARLAAVEAERRAQAKKEREARLAAEAERLAQIAKQQEVETVKNADIPEEEEDEAEEELEALAEEDEFALSRLRAQYAGKEGEFLEYVVSLYEKNGYKATSINKSRSFALLDSPNNGPAAILRAKPYAERYRAGQNRLRALAEDRKQSKAQMGIFVATSLFGRVATSKAKARKIDLVDGRALLTMIRELEDN